MLLFNRYEYNPQTDLAGKGDFSRVYKAIDTSSNEPVALKIYKINDLSDHYHAVKDVPSILALAHPGLCRYLAIQEIEKEDSFGEKEKLEVCITTFMDGNLVDWYQQHRDPERLKKILPDILSGLSYLHKKGMIHGYIKPANLLVTVADNAATACITDYAMGIHAPEKSPISRSLSVFSAASYLSPEQLNSEKYGIGGKVSFNTDLWSLALVIYEALAGEPLFKVTGADFTETILNRITSFELPTGIQELPEPFNEFISRCLVKDASQRVQTAEALLPLLAPGYLDSKNIVLLAEKAVSSAATANQSTLLTAEDNDDTEHTRIIALPKKNSPKEVAGTGDDDATRFIKRPATQQAPVTALPKEETAPEEEDATQFLKKPAAQPLPEPVPAKQEPVQEKNTGADQAAAEEEEPADQTIILSKINKENPPAEKPAPKKQPASGDNELTGEIEKQPDIIVRRREKPVLLFNRYEYLPATDLIGKGGFSRVYKAYDKKLSRWVALKVYKTGEFSDRYSPIAEIKRVVNLDHSNICRYLDIEEIENENPFGENEKIQVCVMELLDSGNFAEYYKSNKNPETLKKLVQDILNGLSYLHKNGIIHRDIKPANILIKQTIEGPVAKITDFGISKNSEAENNSSSALVVSIPYMAPEQLNARKYGINEKVSFNLDLWSLGVTIYEVVTGKVLFKNSDQDNSEQIMANIMAPDLPEKLSDLPEPFKTIVSHCVIKNARERASRAEELMVLLNTASAPASTTEVLASQAANTVSPVEIEPVRAKTEEPVIQKAVIQAPPPPSPPVEKEKITKSRFSLADPEEKPVVIKKEENNNNNRSLLYFIIAAVVIFILFIIFLKTCNNKPGTGLPVRPADTAHTKLPPAIAAPADTQQTKPPVVEKKKDTVQATAPVDKPVHPKEKKKEKAAEETRQSEPPRAEETSTNNSKYTIRLVAESSCTVKVNGIGYGEIPEGKKLWIYLTVGKYILQFTSSTNSAATPYTITIDVKPENLGQKTGFKIKREWLTGQ